MNKKAICKLFAASVLSCAASVSQAAVVEYWKYDINMKWTDAVFDTSTNINSSTKFTDDVLSWGYKGGVDDSIIGYNPNNARSSLKIIQPHRDGWIKSGGTVDQVNIFRHTNNEINATYHHLLEATLSVSVDLRDWYNDALPIETLTKDFKIFFYETPNVGGTCAWGNCDDDLFAFVAMPTIYDTFTYDGQTYQFNYFQTSGPDAITQFSADICSEISGGKMTTSCYGFKTAESAQTTIQFGISITAVPEPETYAMLLAGLGMVGFVVRRRRNTIRR
ncbi:MAG: THxN family PEP-CTERM protein [Betaproteobacteria bacterium]|nr:THxN family PEP-CTERM protein [Betaproteobacteria bacterium]